MKNSAAYTLLAQLFKVLSAVLRTTKIAQKSVLDICDKLEDDIRYMEYSTVYCTQTDLNIPFVLVTVKSIMLCVHF